MDLGGTGRRRESFGRWDLVAFSVALLVCLKACPPAAADRLPFSFAPCLAGQQSLSLAPPRISGDTVELSGADTRRPRQPFTFDWGDGTVTHGFFPATHAYRSTRRMYTVTVTAHHGQEEGRETVLVWFQPPAGPDFRSPSIPRRVTLPLLPVDLETTVPGASPPENVACFEDSELSLPRELFEYALDVGLSIQLELVNGAAHPAAADRQVFLKSAHPRAMCQALWFTQPASVLCHPCYLRSPGLSSFFHELGHNVTLSSPREGRLGERLEGPASGFLSEMLAQIFQHATAHEILNHPTRHGLGPAVADLIRRDASGTCSFLVTQVLEARNHSLTTCNLPEADPAKERDESMGAFMTAAFLFLQRAERQSSYREPVKRLMALLQTFDERDRARYRQPSNESFRGSLVAAGFSHAFRRDLRQSLREHGFLVDDAVYTELLERMGH